MMILLPSLACNFSFAASLRTRIPRRDEIVTDKCQGVHIHTLLGPKFDRPSSTSTKK